MKRGEVEKFIIYVTILCVEGGGKCRKMLSKLGNVIARKKHHKIWTEDKRERKIGENGFYFVSELKLWGGEGDGLGWPLYHLVN